MKNSLYSLLLGFLLVTTGPLLGGQDNFHTVENEYYVRVQLSAPVERAKFKELLTFTSFDKRVQNSYYLYLLPTALPQLEAWCAKEQCQDLRRLTHPSLAIDPEMTSQILPRKSLVEEMGAEPQAAWTAYPTYAAYVQFLQQMAARYPQLMRLQELGETPKKHKVYVVKLSDQVEREDEVGEAKVLLSGGIHGDEVVGYVLCLQMIEYLLTQYASGNPRIQTLLNQHEIWFMPLVNPDGTYARSDSSITGATRFNARGMDLNRNLPDADGGEHPDGGTWQTESLLFMDFLKNHHLNFAMEFHGGAEVINYPWDTLPQDHPDKDWFVWLSRLYVDTIHQAFPSSDYMTEYENGITNGYAWYEIEGGRQDYLGHFYHVRAITVELSDRKMAPATDLNRYFQYNLESMLKSIEQFSFGLTGRVVERQSQRPLAATLEVLDHDQDNSQVTSDPLSGTFFRPLRPGTYRVRVQAPGYPEQIVENVTISAQTHHPLLFEL